MLDDLYNFLFGRKALESAASAPGTPVKKKKLPEDNISNVGISQSDVGKMAQDQADNELRKKLAAQRAARGANFMGPQQWAC